MRVNGGLGSTVCRVYSRRPRTLKRCLLNVCVWACFLSSAHIAIQFIELITWTGAGQYFGMCIISKVTCLDLNLLYSCLLSL